MCGIMAHMSLDGSPHIDEPRLRALNDLLLHRGPDDSGIYMQGPIAMAMRRLSIVDIPDGHQPFVSHDGRYIIIFNGEIYNHDDLRQQLLSLGYPIKTRSDTEVLLYAFMAWGQQCLNQLNGMFAFAVWDKENRSLFIARDRMGVKPLYYAMNTHCFMLASELTPLVKCGCFSLDINCQAISDYLSYWYICEPQTIYKGIYQLPPGHCAWIVNGKMSIEGWWEMPAQEASNISFEKACHQLEDLLTSAVQLRLKSDVPTGTFLSGGIDSGLISAMVAKETKGLKTFFIGFDEQSYDETALARQTADKNGISINVHRMPVVNSGLITEIIHAFDEPLGNASFVPTYVLSRAARTQMKVVLTGDGGDELFGGYPTYQAPYYQKIWRNTPGVCKSMFRFLVKNMPVSHRRISLDYRLKQLLQGVDNDYRKAHYTWRQVASLSQQKILWQSEIWQTLNGYDSFSVMDRYFANASRMPVANQLMYVDANTFLLNDHLRKVDRMTMAHGLEARLPFMDYRIVEFAMRLPSEHKVNMWQTKRILKFIARRYLPLAVINGQKKGLTSPIASWLSGPLRDFAHQELQGGLLAQLFQPKVIKSLLEDHWNRHHDNSRVLWALLTLQVWDKKHRRAL